MGKHHSSKQGRTHGAYQRRLAKRGLSKAPQMPTLESLRRKRGIKDEDVELLGEEGTR